MPQIVLGFLEPWNRIESFASPNFSPFGYSLSQTSSPVLWKTGQATLRSGDRRLTEGCRVLLTSIGRRNYLIQNLHASQYVSGLEVYGADADPTAPGLAECHAVFNVSMTHDPRVLDEIVPLRTQHSIDLLIALNELDLGT